MKLGQAFFALMIVVALPALDQTIVATALPSIVRDLHESNGLSWIFSAYLIASTVGIPVYGKLADLYGTRRVLLGAMAVFLLGSLCCGLSHTLNELIWARALQGAGGGGLLTLAMTSVAQLFPPAQRGRYQGLLGATYGISTLFGPLLGGLLVEQASWRWAFLINLPLGGLTVAVLYRLFPGITPPSRRLRLDYAGAVLLAAALVAALLGTRHEVGAHAAAQAGSPWLIGLAVLLGGVLVWVEKRAADPIIPLALYRNRLFLAACAMGVTTGIGLFATVAFLPTYLQQARGLSPIQAGWQLTPLMAGIAAATLLLGRRLATSRHIPAMAVAANLAMAGVFVLMATRLQQLDGIGLSVCLGVLGLGIGALLAILSMAVQRSAPAERVGSAMANLNMYRALGGALGIAALAGVLSNQMQARMVSLHGDFALAFAGSLGVVFGIAAVIALKSALLATALKVPALPSAAPAQFAAD